MRVVMLSHVDARWIKQRPHFLAEALASRGWEVTFAYARAYRRVNLGDSDIACAKFPILTVPNAWRRRRGFSAIDAALQTVWALVLLAGRRPQIVWLTSPRLAIAARLLRRFGGARLVYDYMDRNALFDGAAASVMGEEMLMLTEADLVLCSSSVLLRDVEQLPHGAPSLLMRNALGDPAAWALPDKTSDRPPNSCVLGYAGTVSSWFDVAVVMQALESNPLWTMRVWGPVDVELPHHPRLTVEGVVAHRELPTRLAECDVLVMPFAMTPLIEAVDPVKAYEYVASGRQVVLPEYAETAHFEPFVERYRPGDASDFIGAVCRALKRPASVLGRDEFVSTNTWGERVSQIESELKALI